MTDRATVERWLEGYQQAWGSNDPADIEALFAEGARYWTAPHREPWTGRAEIAREWIARKDDPGTWSFRSEILAIAGDLAFVRGWTDYPGQDPPLYSNLWVIRFDDDGRATEFTEWWMPAGPTD
ncbi:MAG TPA: nuclear transport factor 2 family protein [Actinomycetota bacterium]|nr:nuclear transport factor 2 family protein [Actinomycetota bacterium]